MNIETKTKKNCDTNTNITKQQKTVSDPFC